MSAPTLLSLLAAVAVLPLSTKFTVAFQLLKSAGIVGYILGAHLRFAVADIEVDPDKKMQVPLPNPAPKPDARARIVVNVHEAGKTADGKGNALADEEAVAAYIEANREEVEELGLKARVHLRTDEGVQFAAVRNVIRAAARAGVDEVIFVAVHREPVDQVDQVERPPKAERTENLGEVERTMEERVRQRELDAAVKLPSAIPADKQPDIEPFFVKIDELGRIFANTGKAQELLEADPAAKELRMLDRRIAVYAAAARLGSNVPEVQIYAEGGAKQARVLEVIDVLRKHGINRVTFTDLIDAE
jgi:biopolymer transport protein ExbD